MSFSTQLSELSAAARSLLSKTTLAAYLATRPPSTVLTLSYENATVGSALEALARIGVLSAPLVNAEGEMYGKSTC